MNNLKNKWKAVSFTLFIAIIALGIVLYKQSPTGNTENVVQYQSKLYKDYILLRSENGMLRNSIQHQ